MVLPLALIDSVLGPSARVSVKLLPVPVAVIFPLTPATLPFCGLVGAGEMRSGDTLKVGVIEKGPALKSGPQPGYIADCAASRSMSRPMLAPVTVIGDGRLTVTILFGT